MSSVATPAPHTNKFVSFLDHVGHDVKIGLDKIMPFAQLGDTVLLAVDPPLGALVKTGIATVLMVEQKFQASGQQSGPTNQKLADAVTILYPAAETIFGQYGIKIDNSQVENFINALVAGLKAFPAIPATTPAALPAAPAAVVAVAAQSSDPVTSNAG